MPFASPQYSLAVAEDRDFDAASWAEWIYSRVFRLTLTEPGFALLLLPPTTSSENLRRLMVDLKQKLSQIHQRQVGSELCYCSMVRFDQQVTTKFHLDGAPEQSFLMLGYEPTVVDSQLNMADLTQAALGLGITPDEYLERHNPMFAAQEVRLADYVTHLAAFDPNRPQILCINNSRQPPADATRNQLGVFHQATVPNPSLEAERIVNSTMIGICPDHTGESWPQDAQTDFVQTTEISGRRYN